VRPFKRGRPWAETQETSLESDERRENWVNKIDHRKDETSLRCELRFKRRVMKRKREVDKKLRRKRQRRWGEMLKVEGKRAIIYELKKRRWAVPTRFSQFEEASNPNAQTSAGKLRSVSTFKCLGIPIRGPLKPLYGARTPRPKDPDRRICWTELDGGTRIC